MGSGDKSQEIEAKVRVDSHDDVRQELTRQNAVRLRSVHEDNYIFDNADRTFLSGGRGLRVRGNYDPKGELISAAITFKGPKADGPFKKREEIELRIVEPAAAVRLVESLGYQIAMRFEKRRETWQIGDCLIELDEVPLLGRYVEVEGPNEQRIEEVLTLLDLAQRVHITRSYVSLLNESCANHGLPTTNITFEATGQP